MLTWMFFALTLRAETCLDLQPFRLVQPGHYLEGAIHLVPSYRTTKEFQGYLIITLDPAWAARGLKVGDILLELDGVKPEAPFPGAGKSAFFKKVNSFKRAKVERCERLTLE